MGDRLRYLEHGRCMEDEVMVENPAADALEAMATKLRGYAQRLEDTYALGNEAQRTVSDIAGDLRAEADTLEKIAYPIG